MRIALFLLMVIVAPLAAAHSMITTQVAVTFADSQSADVKIDIDLTLLLGSPQKYFDLASAAAPEQKAQIEALVPQLNEALQLYAGAYRLQPRLHDFAVSRASKAEFLDDSVSKHTTFHLVAPLQGQRGRVKLVSPIGAPIDYPVAYTVQVPPAGVSITRWLEPGVHESDAVEWASRLPAGSGPASASAQASESTSASESATTTAGVSAVDPDALTLGQQLVTYLRLGFRHIVPEGLDHILFVLGLFFLGITWRKLLSQTTVFTVAHAMTLFLSTYGIFRLPSAFVEPAIALSISVIALENVFRPRIGPLRLAIVFAFGLIHGFGFASSLSDVPFPRKDFVLALLGFNFGVDFGQLFVLRSRRWQSDGSATSPGSDGASPFPARSSSPLSDSCGPYSGWCNRSANVVPRAGRLPLPPSQDLQFPRQT